MADTLHVRYRSGRSLRFMGELALLQLTPGGAKTPVVLTASTAEVLDPRCTVTNAGGAVLYNGGSVRL